MTKQIINFGIIGCGLMGREFASAAARWLHLDGLPFAPRVVAVCSRTEASMAWFQRNVSTVELATTDYRELLADPNVDAVYCAVPHNLHEQFYVEIIEAGKHLLGEKPFGIDLAPTGDPGCVAAHPEIFVRCASQFPFFPGAYTIAQWAQRGGLARSSR